MKCGATATAIPNSPQPAAVRYSVRLSPAMEGDSSACHGALPRWLPCAAAGRMARDRSAARAATLLFTRPPRRTERMTNDVRVAVIGLDCATPQLLFDDLASEVPAINA